MNTIAQAQRGSSMVRRAAALDWPEIAADLDQYGSARLPALLSAAECDSLIALYARDEIYRSRVLMARHGFGRGEYKYFGYPLLEIIGELRHAFYPHLAPQANRWHQAMGIDSRFPPEHAQFIARCHAAGQLRPTPLILKYEAGDYNCLHQDLYGEQVFPIQMALLLSEPGRDFSGGEFVMTEQRPRMQSRAEVVPLRRGDAVLFAVNERPMPGTRGSYRVKMKHGVSRLRSGQRYAAGVIFHDAL